MSTDEKSRPRILCFHGAGSSGAIFRAQGRKIFRGLQKSFRFVFLDAPFESLAGPGMWPTYAQSGPFYRWQCDDTAVQNFDISYDEVRQERDRVRRYVEDQLRHEDGAPFVGIMGFSQGARVACGLLQYLEKKRRQDDSELPKIKFVVINSGTYPPLLLEDDVEDLVNSTEKLSPDDTSSMSEAESPASREGNRIKIPSLHLHGSDDPWRPESERLLTDFFDTSVSTVIEYKGGHQVPVVDQDTRHVVMGIQELAAKALGGTVKET